ncbi:type 1 glutamine amidotransferase domain-containing protein [Subtercola sp. PAMC28395]|uniref:type 1 glutamine amidotransferase domain-containing protein n=1 Tax=Subtercola sp. PAMC28395 TaxID=2846775 RepID=UPI001C0CEB5B|nr:type 1 glutamine amidotransferase domain-containing protein [Subtercola sp. PAMC28395]QWT23715.1 type 1 glutamine amidotransferase domain-containing protein [Subtercola sp. PAMC28395]
MTSVLIVLSASDHWTLSTGDKYPTGVWAEELVEPHRLFTDARYDITIATPGGVAPTFDQNSLSARGAGSEERVEELRTYLDSIATELKSPVPLTDVTVADFDVVFYPGGHGPMEDLSVDADSGRIMTEALASGRPLGVLCHAPAAMFAAVAADGSWPFTGYRMTGFSDAEEELNGLAEVAPWLVETRLVSNGAIYSKAAEPFGSHVVVDRNLYTGQNPASSAAAAKQIIAALAE